MASSYFIKVYGSQRRGDRPKYSHTFATFTVVQSVDGKEQREDVTISWLPEDGDIKPLGGPEPGQNYTLRETFAWLDKKGSNVRWESPETAIEERLFEAAMDRFNELKRKALHYIMIDTFQMRPHQASNCIHGVTDLSLALDNLGMCYTGVLHGIGASRFVYQYLSPFYVTPPQTMAETERRFEEEERNYFRAAMAQDCLEEPHKLALDEPSA